MVTPLNKVPPNTKACTPSASNISRVEPFTHRNKSLLGHASVRADLGIKTGGGVKIAKQALAAGVLRAPKPRRADASARAAAGSRVNVVQHLVVGRIILIGVAVLRRRALAVCVADLSTCVRRVPGTVLSRCIDQR